MTHPPIPIASILRDRIRSSHQNLDPLADSISNHGLIQPIVLSLLGNNSILVAGGRRLCALEILGHEFLYHGETSNPTKPGYVLKEEGEHSVLTRLMAEIAENLNREDLPWRDGITAITKAFRLAQAEGAERHERILYSDFGPMIGAYGAGQVSYAVKLYDELQQNPKPYDSCTSIRQAIQIYLRETENEITAILVGRGNKERDAAKVLLEAGEKPSSENVMESNGKVKEGEVGDGVLVRSGGRSYSPENFHNTSSTQILEDLKSTSVDHIITDPDYAIDPNLLSSKDWSIDLSSAAVAQSSIEESLADLYTLITEAKRIIRPTGFLVFFYDLDHHEKLKDWAERVGFRVQRWPLIWVKSDFTGNVSPTYNFTKNIEYAMVCRQPNATLAKSPQKSSVFQWPRGDITKTFGHPFAKPLALWKWIYDACCVKGETVLDPFMGSGSSTIAALEMGLNPMGYEVNPDYFNKAILNIQDWCKLQK